MRKGAIAVLLFVMLLPMVAFANEAQEFSELTAIDQYDLLIPDLMITQLGISKELVLKTESDELLVSDEGNQLIYSQDFEGYSIEKRCTFNDNDILFSYAFIYAFNDNGGNDIRLYNELVSTYKSYFGLEDEVETILTKDGVDSEGVLEKGKFSKSTTRWEDTYADVSVRVFGCTDSSFSIAMLISLNKPGLAANNPIYIVDENRAVLEEAAELLNNIIGREDLGVDADAFKYAFNIGSSAIGYGYQITGNIDFSDDGIATYLFSDYQGLLLQKNLDNGNLNSIIFIGKFDGTENAGSVTILGVLTTIWSVNFNYVHDDLAEVISGLDIASGKKTGSFKKDGIVYSFSISDEAEFMFSMEPFKPQDNSETPVKASENSNSSTETTGQRNALSAAKRYIDFSAFSYEGLIRQLEYEKFSHDEAVYGADNCGANWREQAAKSAKSYLSFSAFSYKGLVKQLEYEGFTTEQAVYGVDNCDADWNEQAARSAKAYLDFTSFSRSGLIDQLKYEGFTNEQAIYGVEANGY